MRGELKVETFQTGSDTLRPGLPVLLGRQEARIRWIRPDRRGLIMALEGVLRREDAESLIGRTVAVRRAILPDPAPGEVYLADLLGYRALRPDGSPIGVVAGELVGTPQPMLVLEVEGSAALVPAVAGIFLGVDHPGRSVTLDLPEGLLDLYRPPR